MRGFYYCYTIRVEIGFWIFTLDVSIILIIFLFKDAKYFSNSSKFL